MNSAAFDSAEVSFKVTIRLCREQDLPELEWFGAFTHHRQIFREAFALQQAGEAIMLVADADGFPIGQAWLDLRARLGAAGPLVWAVRVMQPFQKKGIGVRLMHALEAFAIERGHAWLELGVETENAPARAFYERLGWRVVGERRETYAYITPDDQAVQHTLDEWVMVKPIAQPGASRPTRA